MGTGDSHKSAGPREMRARQRRRSHNTLPFVAVVSRPPPGCICHTDRGSQYASARYRELHRPDQPVLRGLTLFTRRSALHLAAENCTLWGRTSRAELAVSR